MAYMHIVQVVEVLPERHGVRVLFRDGLTSPDLGKDAPGGWARVMVPRAHPLHASEVSLPRVGEHGVVIEEEDFFVWLGAIHWQDHNQIDPTDSLHLRRDDAGSLWRAMEDGTLEWLHPSGLRMTLSKDGSPLPDPARTGEGMPKRAPVPTMEFEHPSGAKIRITPGGMVTISSPLLVAEGAVMVKGSLGVSTGASGTFTTPTGQAVTVENGIVTNIF